MRTKRTKNTESTDNTNRITITISKGLHERLKFLGKKGETFDDVITHFLDAYGFTGNDAAILKAMENRADAFNDRLLEMITEMIRDDALPCIVDDPEEWFKVLAPSKELCAGCQYRQDCPDSAIPAGDQG